MVRLSNDRTKWVLFLSSAGEPEDRFIFDLAFGVYCLESRGIPSQDIHIYVDGADRPSISSLISVGTNYPYVIKETSEFFVDSADNDYNNLVMFVTGHGSIQGIYAANPIKPYKLLDCLKSSPALERAIIYLGQCFSGVFNYVGAGKVRRDDGTNDPDVILIGATNLHESLSSNTTEKVLTGDLTWCANVFLLHLFKWISNPVDIDGDTHLTIMDSYKYAGAMSNTSNKGAKIGSFFNSIKLHGEFIDAVKQHEEYEKYYSEQVAADPSVIKSLKTFVDLKAAETKYTNQLNLHLVHQECWILNSRPSQYIEI